MVQKLYEENGMVLIKNVTYYVLSWFLFVIFLYEMAQWGAHTVNWCHCLVYIPQSFFNLETLGNYDAAKEISLETGNYINNSVAAVSQSMSCNWRDSFANALIYQCI